MIQNPVGGNGEVVISYQYKHKLFKLTHFGVNFVNSVCK